MTHPRRVLVFSNEPLRALAMATDGLTASGARRLAALPTLRRIEVTRAVYDAIVAPLRRARPGHETWIFP